MLRGESPIGREGIVRRYHRRGFEISLAQKHRRLPLPHASQCHHQWIVVMMKTTIEASTDAA